MDGALDFRTAAGFRKWLGANHRQMEGIWLCIFKEGFGWNSPSSYAEALDEALFSDGSMARSSAHDELSWRQRFTASDAKEAPGPGSTPSTRKG